ncbi:hypothetical protein [Pseudomonas sp. Irchel s3b2]|uniref:hypothetical protein n=1 Tax=Pseudomonas sp. Irchel s3b2 TaxID=2009073 RepID=UPI000BA3F9C7|nr:hypothetical protein [Pseudomonas sp. Irchel s3b2]
MRVPVYPDDLKRNRGFKSLAKKLQTHWCGPSSVSLLFVQDVLAKGFGYRDYRDLEQSSNLRMAHELPPSEADTRLAIKSAIHIALGSEFHADLAKLERLVGALPISSLVAFNRMQVACDIIQSFQKTGQVPPLTAKQLRLIKRVIDVSGNLRDQAIFACMLADMRRGEFLMATVQGGNAVYRRKFTSINAWESLPSSCGAAVDQYLKSSRVPEGGYLFHSTHDSKKPMSPLTLTKICASWAEKAGIEAGLLSPHSIRKSGQDLAIKFALSLGHVPKMSTRAYIGDLLKPPVR